MDQHKKSLQLHNIPPPCKRNSNIPDILLEFRNVSVSYGEKPILKSINWTIKKGEFWELSGPNGSGKTTLLTMLTGDNPKAYGQDIMLFGRKKGSGESVWDIKEKIGYLTPAMVDLFKRRHTVEQMLISGMVDSIGLYKKPTTFELNLSKQWLQVVGLKHLARTPFIKLSQVQQRMVLILRAMVKHPPVLILDEPSNGLDDAAASMLVHLINKVADESDTAIIYVSHRKEPGLKAHKHYLLMPGRDGSTGKVKS